MFLLQEKKSCGKKKMFFLIYIKKKCLRIRDHFCGSIFCMIRIACLIPALKFIVRELNFTYFDLN